MSLSTLTHYSRHVCSRSHPPVPLPPKPPPHWSRLLRATAVAAGAATVAQLVSAPLDVATRFSKACPTSPSLTASLAQVIRTHGPRAAFTGLPLHMLKRIPTKVLTVAFFELGTQAAMARRGAPLRAAQHVGIAVSSGVSALLATYPIHLTYYAVRKGATFASVARCARLQPRILYSGAVPALMSTAPAVLVDYLMYRALRSRIDWEGVGEGEGQGRRTMATAAVVVAAAASNLAGGFCSEPFKALSRRMAVESVRAASCGSLVQTARCMMRGGVGEFWRGFRVRSLRYAVSAVVSKATVQQLKRRVQMDREPVIGGVSYVAAGRRLHANVGGRGSRVNARGVNVRRG